MSCKNLAPCFLILLFFGVRCFNALTIKFHSNSLIQRPPLVTISRKNVFQSPSIPGLGSFSLDWLSHVKFLKVNLALSCHEYSFSFGAP